MICLSKSSCRQKSLILVALGTSIFTVRVLQQAFQIARVSQNMSHYACLIARVSLF